MYYVVRSTKELFFTKGAKNSKAFIIRIDAFWSLESF